jgi:general secretion pathway protein L
LASSTDALLPMPWPRLQGQIKEAWSWWTGELWGLLPASLRRLLQPAGPLLVIDLRDRSFFLCSAGAGSAGEPLGALPPDDDLSALQGTLRRSRKYRPGLAVILPNVLARTIELPSMARADLDAALRLDMDRQMPFAADEVLFSHRITARDARRGTVTVALTVAPKTAAARPQALAEALGLKLVFLGPGSDDAQRSPAWDDNLWPVAPPPLLRLARRGLLAGLVVLAALALWLPLERDRREAAALAARLAEAQAMEASLRAEKETHAAFLAAAGLINGMRAAGLDLLADVAKSLPDDARLDRLDWRDGRVEIMGRVAASSQIVDRLGALARFESVDYLAPVTRDQGGLERFNLALTLAGGGER